jgi:hypothetical protein
MEHRFFGASQHLNLQGRPSSKPRPDANQHGKDKSEHKRETLTMAFANVNGFN